MHKNKIFTTLALMLMATIFGACGNKKDAQPEQEEPVAQKEFVVKNDSMLYGLCCDGTSDSVIVIWPFKGDPITLNCFVAHREGRIMGKLEIGDWIGVMRSNEDTAEVTLAIDLDQVKGTWTYPVKPTMKDAAHMSKRMQERVLANMSDSIKETYMVPREYGFTLKRSHVAQPVGRVMRKTTLEDDSPVSYPEVKNYKGWYMCSGKLLLVSGDRTMLSASDKKIKPDVVDTMEFVYMDHDSLILKQHGIRYGFHRKESALTANAAAAKALQKSDK